MDRIAVIDIGSNAIRCTVAEVGPGTELVVLADERAQTQLARDLLSTGSLAADRMDDSVAAILRFRDLARSLEAGHVRAIATAAVRGARNGAMFAERVLCETGLRIEIIDGAREAELALASAVATFTLPDPVCIADIGGGSLEVVVRRNGAPETSASLPLGAVVTSNRLVAGEDDPPSSAFLDRIRSSIRDELAASLGDRPDPVPHAVCSGGTITSLIGAAAASRGEDPLDIHGTSATIEEIAEVAARVCAATLADRGRIPGIPAYRAQSVLGGSLVMLELFDLLGTRTVTANRKGIREALLREMADGVRAGHHPAR
ncbi:MAG: hypothetical protein VB139_09560 [Coriobacteriia bacterium]|nr:hypothetical protein [Coriobacteriia bacterium]